MIDLSIILLVAAIIWCCYLLIYFFTEYRMARQHRIEACHNPKTGKYWWHWKTPNNKLFAPGQVYHGPDAKRVAIKEGKQAAKYIKNSKFVDLTHVEAVEPEVVVSKECP